MGVNLGFHELLLVDQVIKLGGQLREVAVVALDRPLDLQQQERRHVA